MNAMNRLVFNKLDNSTRYMQFSKPIIAITGGIASGKSTVVSILQTHKKYDVIRADAIVKNIYEDTALLSYLKDNCPTVLMGNNTIDFSLLRKVFFSNNVLENDLTLLIKKLFPIYFNKAVLAMGLTHNAFLVFEIPLLFENKLDHLFDLIVCVSSDETTQKKRITSRDQSDDKTTEQILKKQMPSIEKIFKSHFVIENNLIDLEELLKRVLKFADIVEKIWP